MVEHHPLVVIGAGPAGAVVATLLRRRGHPVLVLEAQHFPRFSIGESLLSHSLDFVEEAGMLPAVAAAGFQTKVGAAFAWGERYTDFDFRDTYSGGRSTFQVQRGPFDKLLADDAARQGVAIRYGQRVTAVTLGEDGARTLVDVLGDDGHAYRLSTDFLLDASGYGRVLPRLLDLEAPSNFPMRRALFTHVEDRIDEPSFDRERILITTHPTLRDVWFWTIPFSDGRTSLGVVAAAERYAGRATDLATCLRDWVAETPSLARVLHNAVWDTPVRELGGYAANVKRLHGPGFALLGNAAEFLDPVFSSGVTIALRSASLAAPLVDRQLRGEPVDWETEFAQPLKAGVDTFRAYVEGWYDGSFQDVIYFEQAKPEIRSMICAILAGYAWDIRNPFVKEPKRRLRMLVELCQLNSAHPA
ncbi:NAD(P)/FAD-dependent oxidoreductase [Pseudomonas oryzihabitans]|uniref:NAD(P)/FAD-dependent oxidoreductase n=1 Tax=Pseudomonas oryzihabitans TaxID=47885 RepID=UPI0028955070|nr:NAD(P)/FAD-dependent oxidoreductase [Pseudomonas oryzihabitans]MDT3722192.1 NAD(P)/FAD-dependent oxidoreductase [Pseudomonas oryzihabitans]